MTTKTIYFCHDNQSNARIRSNELEMAGYLVKRVTSGVELNRLLTLAAPDLILLDILLDGKNGFEVCDELHHRETTCPPVLIFAGVYGRAGFREEALRVGARDYIAANVSWHEVLNAVANTITDDGTPRAAA